MHYKSLCKTIILAAVMACGTEKSGVTEEQNHGETFKIIKLQKPDSGLEPALQTDALISFYPDGKYTLINTEGQYAENKATDNEIDLTISLGDSVWVMEKTNTENEWIKLTQKGDSYPLEILLSPNDEYYFGALDLLSPGRNWWRKKPAQKQTQKEIEQKLVGQFTYAIDYFKMLDDKESRTFSTSYLCLPFRLYGNGMAIPTYDRLSSVWKNMFYDEEDARLAYKLLGEALKSIGEYPKDPKSHIKGFSKSLQIMISYLEN